MADKHSKHGDDTKGYFSDDAARKAAERLFDEAEHNEEDVPSYAEYAAIRAVDEERGERHTHGGHARGGARAREDEGAHGIEAAGGDSDSGGEDSEAHESGAKRRRESEGDVKRRQDKERQEYINNTIRSSRDTTERRMLSISPRGVAEAKEKTSGGAPGGFFGGISEKLAIAVAIVAILMVIIVFMIISVNSVNAKLKSVQLERDTYMTQAEDYQNAIIELDAQKLQVASLSRENADLHARIEEMTANAGTAAQDAPTEPQEGEQTEENNQEPQSGGAQTESRTHSVVSGDTFWGIAVKYYGDGSQFKKILDANGMAESSLLQEGMKLIIP